jgi:hypothetical protein
MHQSTGLGLIDYRVFTKNLTALTTGLEYDQLMRESPTNLCVENSEVGVFPPTNLCVEIFRLPPRLWISFSDQLMRD